MKRALLGVACALALAPMAALAGQDAKIKGYGADIPLSFALRQIVPNGETVSFGPGVNSDVRVSWKGEGDDWHVVLERLAATSHLAVTYQGTTIRLTVAAPSPAGQTGNWAPPRGGFVMVPMHVAEPPAPAVEVTAAPLPAEVQAPVQMVAQPPAAPIAPISEPTPTKAAEPILEVWHAGKGETVDQVLGEWAERAHWTAVFKTRVIYDMDASADFTGDFVEASGALVKSIRAHPTMRATFFKGNNVVVISNEADQAN